MIVRALITFAGVCLFWQGLVSVFEIAPYILPGPGAVLEALVKSPTLYAKHALTTAIEIVLALIIGLAAGFGTGVLIWRSARAERWLWPLLLASQAVPVFAIAPLLVIWLGYGLASKITMAVMIVFFPVTVAVVEGLRRIGPYWPEQAKLMDAKPWPFFWLVQLPASLGTIGVGARIAAATAPIGAIVGEWVGASGGLGYLMLHANARMQIPTVFAALFCLLVFTLSLYGVVNLITRKLLFWTEER
ncbi:MAG: ABC transporter permease [Rhizobiales bacterium]|nr:ABC transporter permease [Hyphomicrobiales bacterium]